jgi:hypothetical protein
MEKAVKSVEVSLRKIAAYGALLVALPLALQACASSGEVSAVNPASDTGDHGRYSVQTTAAGGSVAWARSHRQAMQTAADFCGQRGETASVVSESSQGVRAFEQHRSELTFECHPKF